MVFHLAKIRGFWNWFENRSFCRNPRFSAYFGLWGLIHQERYFKRNTNEIGCLYKWFLLEGPCDNDVQAESLQNNKSDVIIYLLKSNKRRRRQTLKIISVPQGRTLTPPKNDITANFVEQSNKQWCLLLKSFAFSPFCDNSPFCGATGSLCFGLWLTPPMGF